MGILLTVAGGTSVVLTALSLVGLVIFRPGRRVVQRIGRILDDWTGEEARPGVPARPGVMERLALYEVRQEAQAAAVQAALEAQEARTTATLADIDSNVADALAQISTIHGELTHNGGGSAKDQLTRIDRALNPDTARSRRVGH